MSDEPRGSMWWREWMTTRTFRAVAVAAVLVLLGGVLWFGGRSSSPGGATSPDQGPDQGPEQGPDQDIADSSEPEPPDGPAPPKAEALRVVDVRPVPRLSGDASWLHPSPIGGGRFDRLQSRLRGSGSVLDEAADAVMREAGAIPATVSTMELELEGNSAQPVRITRVQAEIVKCGPPLAGTLFYSPPQGSLVVEGLGFDLDSPDPYAQNVLPGPDDVGPPRFSGDYFAEHEHRLKKHDQVTFQFAARSFEQDCSFRYRFDLSVNGQRTTQLVDNDGEPFRVSGLIRQGNWRTPVDCAAYQRYYLANHLGQGDLRQLAKTPWVPEQRSMCD